MFAVTRLRAAGDDGEALAAAVEPLLTALAARPGFLHGELGRSADDPSLWALVTRWDGVGSYRRGLSAYDVKVDAAPLLAQSRDEPSAFELLYADDGARPGAVRSGRAADAGAVRVGEAAAPTVPVEGE